MKPPRLQILHHPADHFPRGTDHLRDILLCQLFGDDLLAVYGFCHLELT